MGSSSKPDLAQVGLAYARAVAEDLGALIGVEIRLKGPAVEVVDRRRVVAEDDPVAAAPLTAKDSAADGLQLLIPRPEAITLASLLMGKPPDRIQELRKQKIDDDSRDSLGEIMNFACAALSRVFSEKFSLPALALGSVTEVMSPLGDDWLAAGTYLVARFRLVIPDYPDGQLDLIFPAEVAGKWFSDPVRAPSDADRKSHAPASESALQIKLLVIDTDEEARDAAEDLSGAVGHEVFSLDPTEVRGDGMDEVAEAGVIVLEWDLGSCAGLEMLELLLTHPRTRSIPVVMASSEPTERMVRAALRAGAASFTRKPYDPEELRKRIDAVRTPPAAEAA